MFYKSWLIPNSSMLERTYSAIERTRAHKQASNTQALRCKRPDVQVRLSTPSVHSSAPVRPGKHWNPNLLYKYHIFIL